MNKILIASDHAGFDYKQQIISKNSDIYIDMGPISDNRIDYSDYADKLCLDIKDGVLGILVCGSGQGMAMAANKYKHIRAALCPTVEHAKMARAHNNANVLCLGSRMNTIEEVAEIIEVFKTTKFEAGRHLERINKFSINTGDI